MDAVHQNGEGCKIKNTGILEYWNAGVMDLKSESRSVGVNAEALRSSTKA